MGVGEIRDGQGTAGRGWAGEWEESGEMGLKG